MTTHPAVVDAHVCVGDTPHGPGPTLDALLSMMDKEGIDRVVLGPGGRWAAVDNHEANQTLAHWTADHPARLAAYAVANPWFGERACDALREALAGGAVGLKLVPAVQGVGLLSPLLSPLLDVTAEAGRPVYVVTGVPIISEPLQLTELARRRPELTFVMGRSGRTDFSLDFLPAVDSVPNIITETVYNGATLIGKLVSLLGADRVVFASEWPLNEPSLEFERLHRAGLEDRDLTSVCGGSATAVFDLDGATS